MKCPACQADNKDHAKNCRKCGVDLHRPPLWRPDWAWHRRTLLWIGAAVLVGFFTLRFVLKPYMRKLPPEVTPWMHDGEAQSYPR